MIDHCQRELTPLPQKECLHPRDFRLQHMPSRVHVALCGCCFLELMQHDEFVVVVDIRTGMMLPPEAAKERARRLN